MGRRGSPANSASVGEPQHLSTGHGSGPAVLRPAGDDSADQVGIIDGFRSTFGKTYAAEPDVLIEQLKADAAVQSADTLMLTIPSQLGVELNLHILESFAQYVAPALGWEPNFKGLPTG